MKKLSAGLLVYRFRDETPQVLIAHMGSPWWAKKDKGAWSIPKGEYEDGDDPLATAQREFKEELGLPAPEGELVELGAIEQKNNKTVTAWAVEADLDVSNTKSNTFTMEWPPRSGKQVEFPEIDRAEYFDLETAAQKLIPEQVELINRLRQYLAVEPPAKPAEPEQSSLF